MILNNLDNPETNTLGLATTSLAALNSFFQLFNPGLTGIFYIASIGWLVVQIYYKTKGKK